MHSRRRVKVVFLVADSFIFQQSTKGKIMIPITTTNQGRRGAAGSRMPSIGNRNSSSDKKLAAFLVLTGLLLWGVLYMSTGEDVPNVQNPDRRHALGDHEQRSPVHAAVHGHEHDYHHEPGAQPGAAAGTVG